MSASALNDPFVAAVCKRFALCYRTVVLAVLSVLPVYLSVTWCIVSKRLDGWRRHLVWKYRPRPRPHCVRRRPSAPSRERGTARGATTFSKLGSNSLV